MVAEVASTQPWVEKYRPRTVDDVAHQEEVVSTLRSALETSNMPHLLFYGPPGTGKTTTALAIGRQLFGPNLFKSRVMELNASDERGISVVRDKIKTFAAGAIGAADPAYPSPPFKILILDESDSMTQDAQNALRRTMETYSHVTRFCFICNYVSRIIEPLASRCAKFRFKPLHEEIMRDRIESICRAEGVLMAPDAMRTLGTVSSGDLRRAITCLQSAYRLLGSPVTSQALIDVSGRVPETVIDDIVVAFKQPEFQPSQAIVQHVLAEGFSINAVLEQLMLRAIAMPELRDAQKAAIAQVVAEADKRLADGADGYLQLLRVVSAAHRAVHGTEQ